MLVVSAATQEFLAQVASVVSADSQVILGIAA